MLPNSNFWRDKTVCVTGGTGFLGYHLVSQLLEAGARVRILALPPRPDHPVLKLDTDNLFGDLCDPDVVRRAVAGCHVVFHTAGIVAVWGPALKRLHAVHVEGTRNLVTAVGPDTRVVHTSSIVAIGASASHQPLSEDSPFRLDDLQVDYVHAKRASELVALETAQAGRDVVVVNPGYLIGPEDYEGSVMGRFCLRYWKGRLLIAPPGGFNLVDVRDVARGHLQAAEHGRVGRRYILGGENVVLREFVRRLSAVAGFKPRAWPCLPSWALKSLSCLAELRGWLMGKEPFPSFQHARINDYHWFCQSDRARRELGFAPRPLMQSLAETYRWYQTIGAVSIRGLSRWWMRADSNESQAA